MGAITSTGTYSSILPPNPVIFPYSHQPIHIPTHFDVAPDPLPFSLRLQMRADQFRQRFKLQAFTRRDPDKYLPVAHTCFFSLELPAYSSREIMATKLRYAIYNCQVGDAGIGINVQIRSVLTCVGTHFDLASMRMEGPRLKYKSIDVLYDCRRSTRTIQAWAGMPPRSAGTTEGQDEDRET